MWIICNVRLCLSGFITSSTFALFVTYSILTSSYWNSHVNSSLRWVIIVGSNFTTVNNGYRNSAAWWECIQNETIDFHFIHCSTWRYMATTLTPVIAPWSGQYRNREYDYRCTFNHCQRNQQLQEWEVTCNGMWVVLGTFHSYQATMQVSNGKSTHSSQWSAVTNLNHTWNPGF